MIEKTNEERVKRINEALLNGLLSEDVYSMVEGFTNKFGFEGSSFVNGVANPGTKSAKSLYSKLKRKAEIEHDNDFTLAQASDIVRCSIIVDDYQQVVALIKELRKSIRGIQGDVSENSTGYKGIHLSFTIDGFNTEMQIATRDAWFVKQAGEEVYAKWRDFDQAKELRLIYECEDPLVRENLVNKFLKNLDLMNEHNNACRMLFEKLHENTDFEKYKEIINAVLYTNNNFKNEKLPKEVIEKYSVKLDGTRSEEELTAICDEFSNLAKPAQEKLIQIATNALNIAKKIGNQNPTELLDKNEKTFVLLKKEYMKILVSQRNEKYGENFVIKDQISTINKICNQRSLDTIEFCNKNGIKIDSYQTLEKVLKIVNNSNVESINDLKIIGAEKLDKKIEASIMRKAEVKEISGKRGM